MRSYRIYLAFLLVLFSISAVSVSAKPFSDDRSVRTVEQNITRQILKLPRYEVFDFIAFKVDGSTVTLYGKVYNATNKRAAEKRVEDVAGVTRVINNIEVLPPSGFDNSIRRDLYRTLAGTGGLYRYIWGVNPSVRLIVDRGHITLEGYVANKGDYNLMNVLAHGIPGSFSVTNNLVIEDGKAR